MPNRKFLGWIVMVGRGKGRMPLVGFYCHSKKSAKWFALRKLNVVPDGDQSNSVVDRAWRKARANPRVAARPTIHRVYCQ